MLCYAEVGISYFEIPNEISLCIYISGCQNNCGECHYPELQQLSYGDVLSENYINIIDLYTKYITCVCFMGEGQNRHIERKELIFYSSYAHMRGLKTCLYSGRETVIEKWMEIFDYIKIGRYKNQLGSLNNPLTNQRMYKKCGQLYIDITKEFWS